MSINSNENFCLSSQFWNNYENIIFYSLKQYSNFILSKLVIG